MPLDNIKCISEKLEHTKRKNEAIAAELLTKAKEGNAKINWNAITMLLLFGDLLDNTTPFTNVKSSSEKNILPNNKKHKIAEPYNNTYEVYEYYNELINKSVNTIPKETPCVMGLSGGRDSRHILLSFKSQQRNLPRLVTSRHFLGNHSEADIKIAQNLASKINVNIQVVQQPNDRFHQEWDKNLHTGLQTTAHSWGLALSDALSGPEVLFDGMNGGVLFGRSGLLRSAVVKFGEKRLSFNNLRNHVTHHLIERPYKLQQSWLPTNIISSNTIKDIQDQVDSCFQQYEDYNNPLQAFQYHEHVRRNTRLFTYGLMKNEFVICPFDTIEMVNFALNLPWELSSDPHFQSNAISYLFPEFGSVMYSEQTNNLPPSWAPNQESETNSWNRILTIIKPHIEKAGLDILEKSRQKLKTIQNTTLLAQAIYWEEYGDLPSAHDFFSDIG
ncbi:ATP-binding protein [uncultured Microbulbifer sp.]|uniref:ATP-binding protein n=1 Tax=uncultured Microbulbifer sp. TaxID=348147 RepID=UPI002627D870|nr:ATP-binding protein [uncultured Microbulbifer sp.]